MLQLPSMTIHTQLTDHLMFDKRRLRFEWYHFFRTHSITLSKRPKANLTPFLMTIKQCNRINIANHASSHSMT